MATNPSPASGEESASTKQTLESASTQQTLEEITLAMLEQLGAAGAREQLSLIMCLLVFFTALPTVYRFPLLLTSLIGRPSIAVRPARHVPNTGALKWVLDMLASAEPPEELNMEWFRYSTRLHVIHTKRSHICPYPLVNTNTLSSLQRLYTDTELFRASPIPSCLTSLHAHILVQYG